jgi:hypothetical protein
MDGTVGPVMTTKPNIQRNIGQTGKVVTCLELEQLVYASEEVLRQFGIPIQAGSELEKAYCSGRDGEESDGSCW